jgi:dTDP-4-amino-4,6-dideoxygalactose transaminase
MNSFDVVSQFEAKVAAFAGAKYAVAVNTCTSALFLCMAYKGRGETVTLPAHTFVSVPMAAIHAGLKVRFEDYAWSGVYEIEPLGIIDSALRFRKGMYQGGLHCLSFHARKLLNIGEGGMVLTDDEKAAKWLKAARYSGRSGSYRVEDIDMLGWQMYLTPEKAGRGLHLMDYVEDWADQVVEYPDLREVKLFQRLGMVERELA